MNNHAVRLILCRDGESLWVRKDKVVSVQGDESDKKGAWESCRVLIEGARAPVMVKGFSDAIAVKVFDLE